MAQGALPLTKENRAQRGKERRTPHLTGEASSADGARRLCLLNLQMLTHLSLRCGGIRFGFISANSSIIAKFVEKKKKYLIEKKIQ